MTGNVNELDAALSGPLAGGSLFAVIDGVRFTDIRRDLSLVQIESRPLYRDEASSAAVVSGPLLVPVRDATALATMRAMTDHVPAVVWWGWPVGGPEGETEIYRHLRSINMVEIPGRDSAWDKALLRHADPNVLASLLMLLSPAQIARFYGRAEQISFVAPEPDTAAPGLFHLQRPDRLPPPVVGFLRIERDQYEQLGLGRQAALERRTYQYLLRNGQPFRSTRGPASLAADTSRWLAEGQSLGLRSERALWKFCFVQLASNGAAGRDPQVVRFFADAIPADPPDRRMDRLMSQAVAQLRAL